MTLIEYSLVSDGTTAGSANSSNLGVIPSGPSALLGFRALIFLNKESSEIEMVEIVCVSVGSFPVSTGGQTVFFERLVPTVVKKVFIRFGFSSLRTARVLSSRLIGPIWVLLWIRCFGECFPVRSSGLRRINLFAEKAGFRTSHFGPFCT